MEPPQELAAKDMSEFQSLFYFVRINARVDLFDILMKNSNFPDKMRKILWCIIGCGPMCIPFATKWLENTNNSEEVKAKAIKFLSSNGGVTFTSNLNTVIFDRVEGVLEPPHSVKIEVPNSKPVTFLVRVPNTKMFPE